MRSKGFSFAWRVRIPNGWVRSAHHLFLSTHIKYKSIVEYIRRIAMLMQCLSNAVA